MELNSEIEFPPIEACLNSPYIKSNVGTPSAGMNSSLNPSAQTFTPRSTINFGNCLGSSTPEQLPQINVEMVGEVDAPIGAGGDGNQFENTSLIQSKTRLNNTKTNSSGRRKFSGKRRLSLTSIANTTVSSIDTNISDIKFENENDTDVLARREKNITYGKCTDAYERYIQVMPKIARDKSSPRTPIKEMKYSRRQWDGLIKHWKIKLHDWDRNSNGAPSHPNSSTPKRPKTKCDRRSLGNSTPLNTSFGQAIGEMLPPAIKEIFSNTESKEKGQNKIHDQEKENAGVLECSQNSGTERIMDWSKECETSEDETEYEETQNKENVRTNDEDHQFSATNYEATNVQIDNEVKPSSSKMETEILLDADKSQRRNDEEGMVYKCVSLVEAIAQFDENTYKEDEDEDYVPPEERGLTLEEIGNDASGEDSDDSSDAEALFYQVVQRNKPFKL